MLPVLLALLTAVALAPQRPDSTPAPRATRPARHVTGADSVREEGPAEAVAPRLGYGASIGTFQSADGHAQQALGVVLQYQPRSGIALGVNPSAVRAVSDSTTTQGAADTELSLGVEYDFAAPWHPSIGVSGAVALPTGNTAGTGAGRVSESTYLSVGVRPTARLALRTAAWHALGTDAGDLRATSLTGEADVTLTDRLTVGVSYGGEVGSGVAGVRPLRTVGATASIGIVGPLTLSIAGTNAIAASATYGGVPKWGLTVGFGTAFAGLSSVGVTSPVSRIAGALTGGAVGKDRRRGRKSSFTSGKGKKQAGST